MRKSDTPVLVTTEKITALCAELASRGYHSVAYWVTQDDLRGGRGHVALNDDVHAAVTLEMDDHRYAVPSVPLSRVVSTDPSAAKVIDVAAPPLNPPPIFWIGVAATQNPRFTILQAVDAGGFGRIGWTKEGPAVVAALVRLMRREAKDRHAKVAKLIARGAYNSVAALALASSWQPQTTVHRGWTWLWSIVGLDVLQTSETVRTTNPTGPAMDAIVNELSIEAFGATRATALKAAQWQTTVGVPNQDANDPESDDIMATIVGPYVPEEHTYGVPRHDDRADERGPAGYVKDKNWTRTPFHNHHAKVSNADSDPTGNEAMRHKTVMDAIEAANLNDREASVFVLSEGTGRTSAQVAALLGPKVTAAAVRKTLERAREKFRNIP